jgi:hypothetical protein
MASSTKEVHHDTHRFQDAALLFAVTAAHAHDAKPIRSRMATDLPPHSERGGTPGHFYTQPYQPDYVVSGHREHGDGGHFRRFQFGSGEP